MLDVSIFSTSCLGQFLLPRISARKRDENESEKEGNLTPRSPYFLCYDLLDGWMSGRACC